MMLKYLLASVLLLGFPIKADHNPTITKSQDGEHFVVSFDEGGAVHACTVYWMVKITEPIGDPNFPDGHYAPRHCWFLDDDTTSYEDNWDYIPRYHTDWEVWSEVGFLIDGKTVYFKTNVVFQHR